MFIFQIPINAQEGDIFCFYKFIDDLDAGQTLTVHLAVLDLNVLVAHAYTRVIVIEARKYRSGLQLILQQGRSELYIPSWLFEKAICYLGFAAYTEDHCSSFVLW